MRFRNPARVKIAFVLLLLAGLAAPAAAVTSEFSILLDSNPTTGCDVTTADGVFPGVDQVLITTVETSGAATAYVDRIERQVCTDPSTDTFGPRILVEDPPPPPAPGSRLVGVGLGLDGFNVVETYIPLSVIDGGPGQGPKQIRLGVTSSNLVGGQDALLTVNPRGAQPILLAISGGALLEIPTLSEWGLILLGLLLAAAALLTLRRRSATALLVALLLLTGAGIAWAAASDLNGTTLGEWGAPLANDLTGDAPAGADIRALFGMEDVPTGRIYFRLDVELVFSVAPDAVDDAYTTPQDTPLNVPAPGVLGNDTVNGATISSFDNPSANGGTVVVNPDGSFTYTPPSGFSGTDTFSYTLSNAAGMDTATVTVNVDNQFPTANDDAATVTEDDPATAVNVLGNDTDPENDPIFMTGASDPANGTVLLTPAGPGPYTGLTYQPDANYCNTPPGTTLDTFTYTVTGGDTATVSMTVTCVNDAPTLDPIADPAAINEDAGAQVVNLTGISAGGGESQPLQVTAVSDNTAVIPNPTVTYASPNATGSLQYTPVADVSGTANITVTVTDGGLDGNLATAGDNGTTTDVFQVVVTDVNDPPTLDPIPDPAAIPEDSGAQIVNLTGITAGDAESQPLQVTAVSDNPGLIPDPTVTYTSPNATGSLQYTPVANTSGTANITVTVTDGGLDGNLATPGDNASTSDTFLVTVDGANDPPTLDPIPDPAAINEDAGAQIVNLTGISAGAGETQPLQVTAVSDNLGLIPNPTVTYTSPNATGSLQYTPVADAFGTANITVTVTDGGLDGNLATPGDNASTSDTFLVTVNAVNDLPTLDPIPDPAAINEDAGAQIVNLTGITAGDAETQPLQVTAVSDNLALIPNPTVTYTSPNATGSLQYTPVADASGTANVTVTVTDGGLDGNLATPGDNATTSDTFLVTVNAVNDPPTLDPIADPAAINEDAGAQIVNLTGITAGDAETQPLQVTAVSDNLALIPNPTVTYTSPNATGSLQYTPVADASGTANVTVTVTDGGLDGNLATPGDNGTTSDTFLVTVNAVNDPPTLDPIADPAAINEDAGAQIVNLTGITAGDAETQPLQVTAVSDNLALIPNPTVLYTSPNATGSLQYTPVANAFGTANVTVTVTDGGLDGNLATAGDNATTSDTFLVTVNAVNDPPSFDLIPDPAPIDEDSPQQVVNVTGITAGPGEGSQPLQVTVVSDNTALIPDPTVIYTSPNAAGSLQYTPVANAFGMANITVTLTDGGADDNLATPGDNLTFVDVFVVEVTAVNDAPTVVNEIFETFGNTELKVDIVTAGTTPHTTETTTGASALKGVLDNDGDFEGDPITVTAISGCMVPDPSPPFDCTLSDGAVVHVEETGEFTYTPGPGDTVGSFTYTVTDQPALGTPLSVNGTVTFTIHHMIWYVDPGAGGGGNGTSALPFNSLTAANVADTSGDGDLTDDMDGPGHYIFIHNGTLAGGIELEANQRLIGEGEGLLINQALNGNPITPLVPAGAHPELTNGSGNAVTVTEAIPVEVLGLSLEGSVNAIDMTTDAALAGSGTLTIDNNIIRNAGAEGIDVNLNAGTTGTLMLNVTGNTWDLLGNHLNNAFDARTASAAANLRLNFSDNSNILSTGAGASGVFIDGSGGGTLTIAGFANNTVHQNTVGNGILVSAATFDANPGAAGFQQVSGGVTVVGAPGDGVGGSGIDMSAVSGDLALTDLDIFAGGNLGLRVVGTGAFTGAAGTRLTVGAGVGIIEAPNSAVTLSSITADLQLSSLKSTNTSTNGVSLTNVSDGGGTNAVFSAGSGSSITTAAGATGPAFNVSGGNADISYAGTITNNSASARAVSLTGWSGDDPTDDLILSGAIDENGAGILVSGNGGSRAITFSGGMDIDTTTGEGFAATSNTNALGLHITGTNTIDSISATALRVTNTPIGLSNLNFQRISSGNNTAAADPVNGIVLSNTGSSGGLIVTGSGGSCTEGSSTCTGGWIQNVTGGDDSGATPGGTGIVLNNTANVSLTRMRINDTSNYGIRGTNVSGFTFTNGVVDGANGTNVSTPFNEGSLVFFGVTGTSSGMTGTSSITNSTIMGGRQRNIAIDNSIGTLNLTVSGNTIKRTSDAAGDDGLFLEADTSANVTLAVTNNTFARHGGDHINVTMLNNAVVDLTITGNTLHGNYPGTPEGNHPIGLSQGIFVLGSTFNGTCTYEISNNGTVGTPFRGNRQVGAIHVNKGSGTGTFSGSIENNVIGDPAVTGSGSSEAFGIIVGARGAGSHTTLINNNLVRQYFDRGIVLEAGEGSAAFNATVTNNTVSNFADGVNSLHGIHSDNGILVTDTNPVCLQISGNSVATAGNEPGGGADIRLRRGSSTTVRLPGVAGATNADATNLLQANNPTATTITVTGNGFSSGAACPLP